MEQNVVHSSVPLENISDESFGQCILKGLLKGGSNIAMVDGVTGKHITYSDIRLRTISLAKHFKLLGLQKNDVILICDHNSLDYFIPSIAAMYLGVISSSINPSYVTREIIHAMKICKPKVIFSSVKFLKKMLEAAEQVSGIQKVICFGKNENLPPGVDNLDDYLYDESDSGSFEVPTLDPDHVISIMYSSGTTGLPKGVMLTHRGYLVTMMFLKNPKFRVIEPNKVTMALLPFFHVGGLISTIIPIAINMKTIMLPRFEENLFLSSIEKYRITHVFLVPPLMLFLAKSPAVTKYNLSSIEAIFYGAAPMSKGIPDMVKSRLKILNMCQGYGMTEMTFCVIAQPAFSDKTESCGVLVPGMSCKVVNPETDEVLGPHKQGELCFKGPYVMKGYCGDQQATDAIFDKDGWLHTGDLGYYDNEEYFYIVDRLKELIKFKGFQVPPAELEALLIQHPQIKDAAVIGVPDEACGELAKAFVIKQSGSTITEQDIVKYIEGNVSFQKRLHGGVTFVDEIPKNPSGKILRRILRTL